MSKRLELPATRLELPATRLERGRLVTVLAMWRGKGPHNSLIQRADGSLVVRPHRGLRKIAGPITQPHPIEECYGSRLHCWSHDTDEPDLPCYRACLECKHVFRSPDELLAGHNAHLAVYGGEPETDASKVYTCPHCIHDF